MTGYSTKSLKDKLGIKDGVAVCVVKAPAGYLASLGVREIGLRHGLVDVKGAAVDDTWSGLKFVYRLTDRSDPSARSMR